MGLFFSGQWRMEASRGGGVAEGWRERYRQGNGRIDSSVCSVAGTRKNDKLLKTFKWGKYVAYI